MKNSKFPALFLMLFCINASFSKSVSLKSFKQKPNTTTYQTFAEIDSELVSMNYTEVTAPTSFTLPSVFTGSFTLHYYIQNITNDVVVLLAYGNTDDVPADACDRKHEQGPDPNYPGQYITKCTSTGNECKVEINPDNNKDFKIICCG